MKHASILFLFISILLLLIFILTSPVYIFTLLPLAFILLAFADTLIAFASSIIDNLLLLICHPHPHRTHSRLRPHLILHELLLLHLFLLPRSVFLLLLALQDFSLALNLILLTFTLIFTLISLTTTAIYIPIILLPIITTFTYFTLFTFIFNPNQIQLHRTHIHPLTHSPLLYGDLCHHACLPVAFLLCLLVYLLTSLKLTCIPVNLFNCLLVLAYLFYFLLLYLLDYSFP